MRREAKSNCTKIMKFVDALEIMEKTKFQSKSKSPHEIVGGLLFTSQLNESSIESCNGSFVCLIRSFTDFATVLA